MSELIKSGVADGLSDLIARLVREEFERRFPNKDTNAVLRKKIQNTSNEMFGLSADKSSNDNGKKTRSMKFRCPVELKRRFEKIAKMGRREPSDLARIILEDHIAEYEANEFKISIK